MQRRKALPAATVAWVVIAISTVPALEARTPNAMRSSVTGKIEHLGQCFNTRVKKVTGRLGGRPDLAEAQLPSGTAMFFTDGHTIVSYDFEPKWVRSHRADPIRICVKDLPQNCPPGDTRGFGYKVENLRTKQRWEAGDTQHVCGGA